MKSNTTTSTNTPRIVTTESIKHFEKIYPAYKGVGQIMLDIGIWVIKDKNPNKQT